MKPGEDGMSAPIEVSALTKTFVHLADLAEERSGDRISFADTQTQPRAVITSPEWSGSETGGRRYSPFVVNVERRKPWHTLSGRMHFFLDHDWMIEYGESLPTYRPPLDFVRHFGEQGLREDGRPEITGVAPTLVNLVGPGYDYRTTVARWFRGLFTVQPEATTVATAPLLYQIHVISAWVIWAVWPFSRLVHAWSYPLWYLWRPYVVYRSRKAKPPTEPGTGGRKWRKIGTPY